ncbi:MAG: rhodanese-related sulfurtransferase [Proteobacteria bacterium]|nr:rhodanese-related sulfurtransferase [Pseudomonadota bacterium]
MRVATFYRFVEIDAPEQLRAELNQHGHRLGLKGTILIAAEGINATITGCGEALAELNQLLGNDPRFADLPVKYSDADVDNPVFHRFKVRLRPEIVSFGQPQIKPAARTGEHVDPRRWNELLEDPDVIVIDTRNRYEIGIGTFAGAVNPNTTSFREFAGFVERELDPATSPRVAMCCTGGIRCEKASAYMLQKGFAEVYQLDGGILQYLENVDPNDNRWHGECFVFDQRISVDPELKQGRYQQCFACRSPLSILDRRSPAYVEGVSCPHCIDNLSEKQKSGFAERQRQVQLALLRGEAHIGAAQLSDAGGKRRNPT